MRHFEPADVGYDTEDTRSNYNYLIPSFRTVSGDETATDIQLLQLDDTVASAEVTFQFLTARRRKASEFSWVDRTDAPYYGVTSGQGVWVDDSDEVPETPVTIPVGNAVQMDFGDYDDVKLTTAGQVSDADLSYVTRAGYNYIGNPYPADNQIHNIQLSENVSSGEVTFQFLTNRRRKAAEYTWVEPAEASYYVEEWPAGLGLWVNDADEFDETVTMKPSEAVQLDMGEIDGEIVTVYAPIEI